MGKSLAELSGEIIQLTGRSEADVLTFTCPLCSSHSIMVGWNQPSLFQSGAVWEKTGGSTIADISIAPSINRDVPKKDGSPSSCRFHGWVKNGIVMW